MQNNKNKKILTAAMAIAAAGILTAGTFAYFSDNASTSATATAGTVDITLDASKVNLLDEEGKNILNPGDQRVALMNLTNEGNKSVDVRTTIKLTSSVAMTEDENGQAEYELYTAADVELIEGKGYAPKAGATPLEIKTMSSDGLSITYSLPDFVLNGNSDLHDEVETEEGIDTFTHEYDYVLVFRGSSDNDFQASTVQIDVLAEAKQHRNTSAGWEVVSQESFTVGNITQDAVPSAQ